MMADNDSVFEDGENLQAAIGKALKESKALLCFVSDDGDDSTQWEVALLDEDIRAKLQSTTVLLRLSAGSEQAGYLGGVCPITSIPAIVIIHNAQVVVNYQNDQTTFDQLQKELNARYASSGESEQSTVMSATSKAIHIDLPPSEGRMRLPNNAYDEFRKLTQQHISAGLTGRPLLRTQILLLQSLKIDVITTAIKSIQQQFQTITEPTLPDEVVNRLLNTPASKLQDISSAVDQSSRASQLSSSASSPRASPSNPTPPSSSSSSRAPPPPSSPTPTNPPTGTSRSSQPSPPTDPSQSSQRANYIATHKARETSQADERTRLKAQAAADKAARRTADKAALTEQRRIDLLNLRKANSTTSDPQSSDIRIQVRLFDGATIRKSFPAEATVARDVRDWIDGEVSRKVVSGGALSGQPYNLKLILTPLPNRTVEAGEEDAPISDLDGVRGSATMVMVPVRGYVESYSGVAPGGIVGGVVGSATSMVGAGIGLVGSAAGLFVGGLGRLLGAGTGTGASVPSTSGAVNAQQQRQQQQQQPQRQPQERVPGEARESATGSTARPNVRMRTLADQRMDEEDDRRKKGTQLYNGMGLNVQPRKDEDETK